MAYYADSEINSHINNEITSTTLVPIPSGIMGCTGDIDVGNAMTLSGITDYSFLADVAYVFFPSNGYAAKVIGYNLGIVATDTATIFFDSTVPTVTNENVQFLYNKDLRGKFSIEAVTDTVAINGVTAEAGKAYLYDFDGSIQQPILVSISGGGKAVLRDAAVSAATGGGGAGGGSYNDSYITTISAGDAAYTFNAGSFHAISIIFNAIGTLTIGAGDTLAFDTTTPILNAEFSTTSTEDWTIDISGASTGTVIVTTIF